MNADLIKWLRCECAQSGLHEHDGCDCSETDLLFRALRNAGIECAIAKTENKHLADALEAAERERDESKALAEAHFCGELGEIGFVGIRSYAALRASLISLAGTCLNELAAKNLPLEWSPNSGLGEAQRALGCDTFEDLIALVKDEAGRHATGQRQGGSE